MTDPQRLDSLLLDLAHTAEAELDCEQVLERVAEYYEQLTAPEQPGALAQVRQHMEVCPCCRQELELLAKALEGDA